MFLFLFIIGCDDGKIGVTGSISYEGIAPDEGMISFIAENGAGSAYGGPYTNGHYDIRAPEGVYLVRISGRRFVPLDKPIPGEFGRPPTTTREEIIIPDVYGNFSKLQVEITKSKRKHDFNLKTPETE